MNRAARIVYPAAAIVIAGLITLAAPAVVSMGAAVFPPKTNADAAAPTPSSDPSRTASATPTIPRSPTAPATPTSTPSPTASRPPTDCENHRTATINLPNWAYNTRPVTKPELVGEIYDTGPREYATGHPTQKAGKIVAYTVQPGDALQAIAIRFCISTDTFGAYNHTMGYDLQPGDVLLLRPDPTKPWDWEH